MTLLPQSARLGCLSQAETASGALAYGASTSRHIFSRTTMGQMLIVAGLLLGPPTVAVAQQPRPPSKPVPTAGLSLSDAIAVAREKNPAFRQAQNNRAPAAWGVRGAYSSLLIPSIIASGGMSYTGPGSQTFLSSSFTQSVSTVSSFYDVGLLWQLSGTTLSQPGLAKAQQRAADADVAGAENLLVTGINSSTSRCCRR